MSWREIPINGFFQSKFPNIERVARMDKNDFLSERRGDFEKILNAQL